MIKRALALSRGMGWDDGPGSSATSNFDVGLGLRAGAEPYLPDWFTPEKIAKLPLRFDENNRPTLSQPQSDGKVFSWTFAPNHGYAIVKYSGKSANGEPFEIVADDFRMVSGILVPSVVTQRLLADDGSELIRWTDTIKSYTINDPQNTEDRYWLKWPKGTQVADVRAHRHVRTTSDGQILDDKTLAALPTESVPSITVNPTPAMPQLPAQPGVKEMPTGLRIDAALGPLSDPKLVGPIKLPESRAKEMPMPFGLGEPEGQLADPQSQGVPPSGDQTPTSQPAPASQGSVKFEGSPGAHVDLSQEAMQARLRADLGLRTPTATVTHSALVHLMLKAPPVGPVDAPTEAFKLGNAVDGQTRDSSSGMPALQPITLVPATAPTPEANRSSSGSFGPLVQCHVGEAVDLNSGKLAKKPESVGQGNGMDIGQTVLDTLAWMERERMDAILDSPRKFLGITVKVERLKNDDWQNLTVEQLHQVLSKTQPKISQPLNPEEKEAATYAFQTREGSEGILQVLKFSDEGGVDIRCKLSLESSGSK